MNQTISNIMTCCSIRQYNPQQITDDELKIILNAGVHAASGKNTQCTKLIAVQNKDDIALLSKMNADILGVSCDPFFSAPTVVIVVAENNDPNNVKDGSLVIGNMMLAAHSIGIGSCWINRADKEFDTDEGKSLLQKWGIKGDYIGVGHCTLGYPAETYEPSKPRRKPNRITIIK